MANVDNFTKFNNLRKEYDTFIYESFTVSNSDNFLNIKFSFNISGKIFFNPTISIPNVNVCSYDENMINNIVFHIGMIEMLSYWKMTCSPKIVVKPFNLSAKMADWWRNLYFNGLGEFFHVNNIKIDRLDLVEFYCEADKELKSFSIPLKDCYLVPVGGGKDSVVTMSILKESDHDVKPFILNPRGATVDCVNAAGFKDEDILAIFRVLDPLMIEMNKTGFLNGHTPFSALLAFITLLGAVLTGRKNIALSNESSANEPTLIGSNINHQYSKSYEFESLFKEYVAEYISKDFNYFSFLRPLSELQIAYLFSKYEVFFNVFKSCNVGSKSDLWCCNCPKCLFAYIILSPFLDKEKMIGIFGSDLFDKEYLLLYLKELTGISEIKPFECVGTIDEVNAALVKTIQNYGDENLPVLLDFFKTSDLYANHDVDSFDLIMNSFDDNNYLNTEELSLLKCKLNIV